MSPRCPIAPACGSHDHEGGQRASPALFQNLSAKQLAAVDRLVTTIGVPAGRELIRQGEPGREFIVVVDGEAEVRRDGEVIAVRGPGTFSVRWHCCSIGPGTCRWWPGRR